MGLYDSVEAGLNLQIAVIFHDSSVHTCWKAQTFNLLSDMSIVDIMVQVQCWNPVHKPDLHKTKLK